MLLPLYLAHPAPRPSLVYLPATNPATLLYSLVQDQLLFLAPCASDTQPLQVLEFLHRVADVLEDFLGAPLLAAKIEANYHVVAQLLNEMVDGGIISCTEPNALRDLVDAPSLIKSLLGGVGLPSTTPSSLAPSSAPFSLGRGGGPSPRLAPTSSAQPASPVPWRRANVRHTSNEMYVDIIESLAVTLSPSGRPLSAIANGSIAFTAKVSGVPDLVLNLACPGGISNAVSLPVFHPCVRLNRWKERPGELSFVPPDGRFVLAGYEVDLLGASALDAFTTSTTKQSIPNLNIPATASVRTSLGPTGSDFEVRLQLNPRFTGKSSAPALSSASGRGGLGSRIAAGGGSGTSTAPAIEEMIVHIPLPPAVQNILDLRVARGMGDASYAPGSTQIEWRISSRDIATLMSQDRGGGVGCHATLSGTVVGQQDDEDNGAGFDDNAVSLSTATYNYDDDAPASYQSGPTTTAPQKNGPDADEKRRKANKILMPSAATVSFSVKGWLPSGIKVEGLNVDQKKSAGLGGGVTPYKGVKYLCVSRKGVECRC